MNNNLLWIVGAYLLGSIPTGLLLGKLYGIDVRNEGSGNIGATNLYRTMGRKVGIITLVGDCLKGLLPVLLAWKLGLLEPMQAWVGLAAFCGHVFSVFLLHPFATATFATRATIHAPPISVAGQGNRIYPRGTRPRSEAR